MLKRTILAILLVALLLLIFGASSQDGEQSGRLSAWATGVFNGVCAALGLAFRVTEHFVRKAAHFTEYALLGVLLLLNAKE